MALRSQRSLARPRPGRDRPLRRWLTVPCIVAALLMAACGGGSAPVAAPSSPSSSDQASSSSTGAAGATSSSSGQPASTSTTARPKRSYPGGGPTDIVTPPGTTAYEDVSSRAGCEKLLGDIDGSWRDVKSQIDDIEGADTFPLYESAAYACLGRWQEAKASFDQIHSGAPAFVGANDSRTDDERKAAECARKAMLSWVTSLIHDWEADHTFSPEFVTSSGTSPCPSGTAGSTGSTEGSASGTTSSSSSTTSAP